MARISLNKIMDKILSRDLSLLLYKLFNDTLILLVLTFFLLLLAEGLIPGFATRHLSFTAIILALAANWGAVVYLGKRNNITFNAFDIKKNKTWLILFLLFFIFLLIRALYKFSWWETIIIVALSIAILYYFYRICFVEKQNPH